MAAGIWNVDLVRIHITDNDNGAVEMSSSEKKWAESQVVFVEVLNISEISAQMSEYASKTLKSTNK